MHMHMHMHTAYRAARPIWYAYKIAPSGQPLQCDFATSPREALARSLFRQGMGAAGRESPEKGACVHMECIPFFLE